jgi:hypothetical protein
MRLHGVISQKAFIFMLPSVITWNLTFTSYSKCLTFSMEVNWNFLVVCCFQWIEYVIQILLIHSYILKKSKVKKLSLLYFNSLRKFISTFKPLSLEHPLQINVHNTKELLPERCKQRCIVCSLDFRGHKRTPWSTDLAEKLMEHPTAQEIPRLSLNPKVTLPCSQEKATPVPILNHMTSVRTLRSYFLKFNFNNILPSTPVSSELSLPFRLSNQVLYACRISCALHIPPAHLIRLDLIILMFGVGFELRSFSLCSLLPV